ncbi:hypothetical protein [Corynebacterium freiburgense]|uniref:hypothetical protein n=1 Tax=Corynebacterium freiburgense TaxID=556548 RepID=UPI00047AD7BD|nr:hypothetical protein [Corynebacterium freiburgense]
MNLLQWVGEYGETAYFFEVPITSVILMYSWATYLMHRIGIRKHYSQGEKYFGELLVNVKRHQISLVPLAEVG